MGQPICLFGEEAGDRRERLRNVIVKYYIEEGKAPVFFHKFVDESEKGLAKDEAVGDEIFYTEGSQDLRDARFQISKFSLPRAQKRLVEAKRRRAEVDRIVEEKEIEEFLNSIPPYEVKESQYGDDRCISRGVISPDEELFATSGWSGVAKIWGLPDC